MAERIHIVNTGDDMGWFAPSPFRLCSRPRSRPRRSQASTAPDRQRLVAFDLRLGVARSLLGCRPFSIDIQNATLSKSSFNQIEFLGATFKDSNLSGWRINDNNFSGFRIENATLSGIAIENCRLVGVKLDGVGIEDMLQAYNAARD